MAFNMLINQQKQSMASRQPSHFDRRILLATVGLAPQVLTETLYAIAVKGKPPFIPNEIHVITTEEGHQGIAASLLDPASPILPEFAREFDLGCLADVLSPRNIYIIRYSGGEPLFDIESEPDSEAAADFIIDIVRDLTSDENAALHVSIAGGRKTMGFLLGYALSLFGRVQDQLSHVLVNRDFENHPKFFYPPRTPLPLLAENGTSINTDNAKLALASIPFLRLRPFLPQSLLDGDASFSNTIKQAQAEVADPELVIDIEARAISCHGVVLTLQPLPFAIYAWLARRRLEMRGGDGATHWSEADPKELLEEYRSLTELPVGAVSEQQQRWRDGIPSETLEQNKARINGVLRRALGRSAEPYLIKACGRVPRTRRRERIGLRLAPETIRFGSIPTCEGTADCAP